MFLSVCDSHLPNHRSWYPSVENNTYKESTFIRKWGKKGRTEDEDTASDLGHRVPANSYCFTISHASQGMEF